MVLWTCSHMWHQGNGKNSRSRKLSYPPHPSILEANQRNLEGLTDLFPRTNHKIPKRGIHSRPGREDQACFRSPAMWRKAWRLREDPLPRWRALDHNVPHNQDLWNLSTSPSKLAKKPQSWLCFSGPSVLKALLSWRTYFENGILGFFSNNWFFFKKNGLSWT